MTEKIGHEIKLVYTRIININRVVIYISMSMFSVKVLTWVK